MVVKREQQQQAQRDFQIRMMLEKGISEEDEFLQVRVTGYFRVGFIRT